MSSKDEVGMLIKIYFGITLEGNNVKFISWPERDQYLSLCTVYPCEGIMGQSPNKCIPNEST